MIIFAIAFSYFYYRILENNNSLYGVNLFSAYTLGYFIYYVVVPALIELLCFFNDDSKGYFDTFLTSRGMPHVLYPLMILVFFVILVSSYKSTYTNVIVNQEKLYKYSKIIGRIALFAGAPALILYFHYLGGLLQALSMAEYARSMAYDMADVLTANQVRLVVIVRLLILAPMCFFIVHSFSGTKINKLFIILSVIFTYIYLLFNASRTIIAIFTVSLLFPLISQFTNHPWRIIVLCALLGSNILNVLDTLFIYFASDSNLEVKSFDINHIVMQFSFAYRNALNAFEIVDYGGCRYFQDIATSFLNYVPGLHFQSSTEPTSEYWGGSDWRTYGGIPNDVITYSILEGHIIGFVVFPIIIGKILRRVDNVLSSVNMVDAGNTISTVVKPYIMMALFFCIPSADLQSIIGNYTIFVFFCLFIYCSSKHTRSYE